MPLKTANILQVNWRRFMRMMVPLPLRKPKLLSLLYAGLGEIGSVHTMLLNWRKSVQYRLGINYQKCNIERLLNDSYDVDDRRIYISKQEVEILPKVLFNVVEQKPLKLFRKNESNPLVLHTRSETPAGAVHFIVYIPVEVWQNDIEIAALIRSYCLETKTFKIVRF